MKVLLTGALRVTRRVGRTAALEVPLPVFLAPNEQCLDPAQVRIGWHGGGDQREFLAEHLAAQAERREPLMHGLRASPQRAGRDGQDQK